MAPTPPFSGAAIPMVLLKTYTTFFIVRYRRFDLKTFLLTFWKCHYFSNVMWPTPTNLGMEIPVVCSDSENNAFFRRLTCRADFLGLIFLTFWSYSHCRARNGDSRMVWHLSIGNLMEELWMDEVWIFETSSIDCE
jgi:hypothetical protein